METTDSIARAINYPKVGLCWKERKSTGEEEMFDREAESDCLMASLGPPDMTKKMGKHLFDYPSDLL
jgi:hypothetical protein